MVGHKIKVIIPAFNEQDSVGKVVRDIPTDVVNEIIVVDNASTDNTAKNASIAGATVLSEIKKGYGNACLKGINYLIEKEEDIDIIVFLDADYSDFPEEIMLLLKPIIERNIDMVIGSRALGTKEKGALTPQQIFGNWLATKLIKLFYKVEFSDLGPFRAIQWKSLLLLNMKDKTYGWTVEMQVKAAKHKMSTFEVPVSYRKRIGVSKVSGTVKGTIMAGYKIIGTIIKYL